MSCLCVFPWEDKAQRCWENGEKALEMTSVRLPAVMEIGHEKDNESPTVCCFLCSASGFTLIFIFSQLVFLFYNTGICSEQHPRSRKSVCYLRDPSITIFGCVGLRSEGRAGLVPAAKKTGRRNSCPLSRMQQKQSLQQVLKKNPTSSGSGCSLKTPHLLICFRDVNHS